MAMTVVKATNSYTVPTGKIAKCTCRYAGSTYTIGGASYSLMHIMRTNTDTAVSNGGTIFGAVTYNGSVTYGSSYPLAQGIVLAAGEEISSTSSIWTIILEDA